jgi:uncharacterized protein
MTSSSMVVKTTHHYHVDNKNYQDGSDASALMDRLLVETEELMNLPETSVHVSCYSGGVDSSLATILLAEVDERADVRAVLGVSPAVSREQLDQARRIALQIMDRYPSIQYSEIKTNEGSSDLYLENNGQACFACKSHLYSSMQAVAKHVHNHYYSSNNEIQLYNGTNADDTRDPTRVGLQAAQNFRVQSPLRSITKEHVRIAAKALGLENWNAAASPCLRSRLAFGVQATQDHLHKIELAERQVRLLLGDLHHATTNLRVRMLAKKQSRIEIDEELVGYVQDALRPKLEPYFLEELGFSSVAVSAFRSGSVAR